MQKANYVYRLYLKVGFTVVDENEEEYIMVCDLWKTDDRKNDWTCYRLEESG